MADNNQRTYWQLLSGNIPLDRGETLEKWDKMKWQGALEKEYRCEGGRQAAGGVRWEWVYKERRLWGELVE